MTNSPTLDELERLNRSLLARQAASIEILKAISASPDDPQPVFDLIARRALELCDARAVTVAEFDGTMLDYRAMAGFEPAREAAMRAAFPRPPGRETLPGRVALAGEVVIIPDVQADMELFATARALGSRTAAGVPILSDGQVIGVISPSRFDVRPFDASEITLLQSFAELAAIAITSAKAQRALKARTDDLKESLEYQTATSDVLKVISRSTFDLQPVLDTVVEAAARLCGADAAAINLRADDLWWQAANFGVSSEYNADARRLRARAMPIDSQMVAARVVRERKIVQVEDAATIDSYSEATIRLSGQRTTFGVPMLRDGEVIGVIILFRRHVELFTQRQIDLVATFADQAVIAIENVRLLNELQARTAELAARNSDFSEQITHQSATIDVLKAMSASPGDPQPVFDLIVHRAREVCGSTAAEIVEYDGSLVHCRALHTAGDRRVWADYLARYPRPIAPNSQMGRAIFQGKTDHIPDIQTYPGYGTIARGTGMRSAIIVPLLRDGVGIGVINLADENPGGFSDSRVALLKTFAEQAVIAISSAETFRALETRTAELTRSVASAEAALSDLKRAQDRLVQSEKMASLGQLTAGIAHEIKNPLNFVNNFSDLSIELIDELREILAPAPLADTTRAEIDDLTILIKSNLGKIVQHGRRADSIVKNMLLHSRASGGDMRDVDLNATVEEALNLAYHGARAEKPGFNITFERNFDPAAGTVALYPQEFTRVLLNMFSNGFYATTKKANDPDFDPTLTVITEGRPDAVIIRIRDNGIGIPDAARARLFEPFFTTKPAGEGTGLGLSLSHDIIVKQHNGSITVESVNGSYTEFTITIPRAGTEAAS